MERIVRTAQEIELAIAFKSDRHTEVKVIDGVLIAANDPWQMADAIMELANDPDRMLRYSENTRVFALARHNDENIKKQLMDCYNSIIQK